MELVPILKKRAEATTIQEAKIVPLLTDPDTEYLNKLREENTQ